MSSLMVSTTMSQCQHDDREIIHKLTFLRWHTVNLPGKNATAGINHAYIAFVDPLTLITDPFGDYIPFETVQNMKTRLGNDTKVLISVGGWGSNFTQAAMNETSRARFALGCSALLNYTGADGIGRLCTTLHPVLF